MEFRKFQLIVVSAHNLPNIRSWGRMKVYAEVSLNEEPEATAQTNIDTEGKIQPRWNFPFYYTIKESSVREPGLDLIIKLYCQRSLGDRVIGHVRISLSSLFEMGIRSELNGVSYPVAGTRDGRLIITYSFGDMFLVAKPSVWMKMMKAMGNALTVILQAIWFVVTGLVIYVQRRRRAYRMERLF